MITKFTVTYIVGVLVNEGYELCDITSSETYVSRKNKK